MLFTAGTESLSTSGDFLVGHLLVAPQDDRHALRLGQRIDGALDRGLQLAVEQVDGRGRGVCIGHLEGMFLLLLIEVSHGMALAPAEFVETRLRVILNSHVVNFAVGW